ncbi:MAG TPA: Spy/CpxP family protein refolding chaperone [Geobacteraceae bacterium]
MNGCGRKTVAALVALAALVPVAVGAADAPQGRAGRGGPPPEAVAACTNKSEGAAVEFVSPRGDTVKAVCRPMGDRLVAVPDRAAAGPASGAGQEVADDGFAGDRGPGGRGAHERFDGPMAKVLGLSASQQKQIEAILKSDRDKNAALRQKMAANQRRLLEAMRGATFNEATVRAIAANQGELVIETIVAMARKRHQIDAVLTPEQRALAEKIQPLLEGRGGEGPHGEDGE